MWLTSWYSDVFLRGLIWTPSFRCWPRSISILVGFFECMHFHIRSPTVRVLSQITVFRVFRCFGTNLVHPTSFNSRVVIAVSRRDSRFRSPPPPLGSWPGGSSSGQSDWWCLCSQMISCEAYTYHEHRPQKNILFAIAQERPDESFSRLILILCFGRLFKDRVFLSGCVPRYMWHVKYYFDNIIT